MSRRTRSSKTAARAASGLLSIGALAAATQIPAQTLRTWERRYGSPRPLRKPSGHRLYPVLLVGQLRKVARLIERGHRPGEILALTSGALDTLVALAGDDLPPAGTPQGIATAPADRDGPRMEQMLLAVKRLDRDALVGMLKENWIRLGPVQFLQVCAAGLMGEVGAAWHDGRLEVRHEHFATACLTGVLREVREPFDRDARGPRVIAAMIPGDIHEGGLLMASVILAMRGWRLVYLGADVPLKQVAAAALEREAHAVALSISATVPPARAAKAVAALRAALPRRTALWTGGAGAPEPPRGVRRFDSLAALDRSLATRG